MPGPKKVTVDIVGDAKGYQKATEDAVKASAGFSGKMDALDHKLEAMGKRGGLQGALLGGAGIGAGIGVYSMVEKGIGMATDALQEAVHAAIEDEQATDKLTQTIRANVTAWDGHTDAIDAAIKSAARLAFTDDQVREGLNALLPRTHDIAEANKLLALSMDLARAKNMDLGEAAGLVGKAYSGQAGALRRAGIAIKDTKDGTKALAQLQDAVAGQAKTYADTTKGSFEALNIQLAEVNETIGYLLLPTVKELANFANNNLTPAIDNVAKHSSELETAFHFLTEAAFAPLLPLKVTAEELSKHAGDIVAVVDDMTGQVHEKLQEFEVPTTAPVSFFDPIVDASGDAARNILKPWKRVPEKIAQDLDPLAGIVKGSVQQARKQAERDMADLKWALTHPMSDKRLRKVWKGELDDAYAALHEGQRTGNRVAIAKAQDLIDGLKKKIKELDALTFSLTGEFHIGKKGAAKLKTYFSGLGEGNTGHTSSHGGLYDVPGHKASGGRVREGHAEYVGERGREVFVPDEDGYIVPNGALGRLGGRTSVVINQNVVIHAGAGTDPVQLGAVVTNALRAYNRNGGAAAIKAAVSG